MPTRLIKQKGDDVKPRTEAELSRWPYQIPYDNKVNVHRRNLILKRGLNNSASARVWENCIKAVRIKAKITPTS